MTAGESQATQMSPTPKTNWLPLVALAIAQFVMVLDQSAMNVSISALVADFDTTVTTIQAVITLYCLVMAMFMLTGGKIGDIIGRRRTFVIGLVIYAAGSATHGGGAVGGRLDPGLVGPGRARCRAGPARDGGADRGQLRGRLAQGGVRRHRRGRRGRDRRGADPRRLGDHGVLVADHLRRRGAVGGADPGDDPEGGRRGADRPGTEARHRRQRAVQPRVWAWSSSGCCSRAPGAGSGRRKTPR